MLIAVNRNILCDGAPVYLAPESEGDLFLAKRRHTNMSEVVAIIWQYYLDSVWIMAILVHPILSTKIYSQWNLLVGF
jgi:hypothetical protein